MLLERKGMTNLDSILKSRQKSDTDRQKSVTSLTKVCTVKVIVFPVVMYRCESWTIKKAEHQRIDAFQLWCWRRLIRVPWTGRRSNQSILKEIWIFIGRTDAEVEAPIFWPPNAKTWLIGKDLDAGKDWRQEGKCVTEDEMIGRHHWLIDMSLCTLGGSEGQGSLVCCRSWSHKELDMT